MKESVSEGMGRCSSLILKDLEHLCEFILEMVSRWQTFCLRSVVDARHSSLRLKVSF